MTNKEVRIVIYYNIRLKADSQIDIHVTVRSKFTLFHIL